MRVIGRDVRSLDPAPVVRRFVNQRRVTSGKVYDVYAVAVFEGVTLVLLVDDEDCIAWVPAWLFDGCALQVDSDWWVLLTHDQPSLVAGPEFIAGSLQQYEDMVELSPGQVERFWGWVAGRPRSP